MPKILREINEALIALKVKIDDPLNVLLSY